jgi:predicted nucleic acid-binding protein
MGDLLIAACAAERGAVLWSLDGDFEPMYRLRWVKRFKP